MLKLVRKFLANVCGYNVGYVDRYKDDPRTWVFVKDPSWYYKPVHYFVDGIKYLFKLLLKLGAYVSLFFIWFGAFTGLTSIVSFVIEPVRRQLRRTRGQIADEKHGIQYHPYSSVRTVEEVKELIEQYRINAETAQEHRELLKDNYIYPLGDDYNIHLKKKWDFQLYKIDRLYHENKTIHVHFGEKTFVDDPEKDVKSQVLSYANDHIEKLRAQAYSFIVSVYPKCAENLNKDLGEFADDDLGKEGIDLLSFWIKECLTLNSIDFDKVKISNKPGWKKMEADDFEAAIKQIELDELMQ